MVGNAEQKIISQAFQSGARGIEMLGRRLQHGHRTSDRLLDDLFNPVHSEKLRKPWFPDFLRQSRRQLRQALREPLTWFISQRRYVALPWTFVESMHRYWTAPCL